MTAWPQVDGWSLSYEGFDPDQEGLREALCTLGNGYFATRGALPETSADDVSYPATYIAGVYDRLRTEIEGRTVENEDLVNVPNWLPLTFRIDGGPWFDLRALEVLEHRQELDLRRGVLGRHSRVRDDEGRVTSVNQRRLVSMDDPHVAALETTFLAENWSGRVEFRSALDGGVTNSGVARYRTLRGDHLVPAGGGEVDDETIWIGVRTQDSNIAIAEAARTRVVGARSSRRSLVGDDAYVAHLILVDVDEGRPVAVEKVATIYTSKDRAIYEPGHRARTNVTRVSDFDVLVGRQRVAWEHYWNRFDLRIQGSGWSQTILRAHIFHLLQTVSEHTIDLDAGAPARGLHGEAYRGHIFWDELFVFPFINLRLSVLTRSLLEYRRRRLPEARRAAHAAGYSGAIYPWQSGSDGREESQTLHLNPRSGRWLPDNSHLQRHINIAVAYNLWQYYQVTGDLEYLRHHAAEVLFDIARFWASIASHNRALDRYEIRGVMGPDEYHDAYPDAKEPGLDNNAYTNVMAVWVLCRALEVLEILPEYHVRELSERLDLAREEIKRWEEVSRRMHVPFHDGIISQFEGYEKLEEFDWEDYRARYGDIQRLDRILEAEGDSTNRYKVSKQADALMLFYLLSGEELEGIFARLGYPFEIETDLRRNVEYYLVRTAHGSTLSRLVHSWVLARLDRPRSWKLFLEALESDIADVQGGTTSEGIHLGAMAGTVDLVQRAFGGVSVRSDVLWLDPALPDDVSGMEFALRYRGHRLEVEISKKRLRVVSRPGGARAIRVGVRGEVDELEAGGVREVVL